MAQYPRTVKGKNISIDRKFIYDFRLDVVGGYSSSEHSARPNFVMEG
jgi:hypothetical protein